jgi:hypothetical protein
MAQSCLKINFEPFANTSNGMTLVPRLNSNLTTKCWFCQKCIIKKKTAFEKNIKLFSKIVFKLMENWDNERYL